MNVNNNKLSKSSKIAVVYGGISKERPGSLISGETVYKSLIKSGYTKSYPVDPATKDFILQISKADVVFLILHGKYGEDGKIQGYLETIKKPYTGPGVLASALGMDKIYFKSILDYNKILTPKHELIPKILTNTKADSVIKKVGLPLFLKPISEGGSLGCNIIHNKKQLLTDVKKFRKQEFEKLIAEKFIKGRSLTVGVIQKDNKISILPILETISKKEFYDYEAKHDPKLHIYKCPAQMNPKMTKAIKNIAKKVFKVIGCYGFCRVDFILDTSTNKPYVLEINTLPGMSPQSNMATSAKAAKITYDQLVITMLKTAFNRPKYLA